MGILSFIVGGALSATKVAVEAPSQALVIGDKDGLIGNLGRIGMGAAEMIGGVADNVRSGGAAFTLGASPEASSHSFGNLGSGVMDQIHGIRHTFAQIKNEMASGKAMYATHDSVAVTAPVSAAKPRAIGIEDMGHEDHFHLAPLATGNTGGAIAAHR